jgi:hypothetical protein
MPGVGHGSTTAGGQAPVTTAMTGDAMAGDAMAGDAMAGMDHGSMGADAMAPTVGDGTRAIEAGFTLTLAEQPKAIGRQSVVLVLTASDGTRVRDVALEQTKPMHLIVVRSDLSGYQHVHPELAADGSWVAQVDFAAGGRWRLVADVSPKSADGSSTRIAMGVDAAVPGAGQDAALPAPASTVTVDGYTVAISAAVPVGVDRPVTFSITKGGAPATGITEYLGAGGHLVALAGDSLAYTHLPSGTGPGSTLTFNAHVPKAGRYRLFLQFATGEVVHTVPFTVDAA